MQTGYTGNESGLFGPWPCSACGKLSQYAICEPEANRIYCENPYCGYKRTILKHGSNRIVLENDGSIWETDQQIIEGQPVQKTSRIRGIHKWRE